MNDLRCRSSRQSALVAFRARDEKKKREGQKEEANETEGWAVLERQFVTERESIVLESSG